MEAIKTKTSLWNYCECLHQNLSIDHIVFYFWCHVSGLLKMQSLELEYIELMESINTMKKFLQKQHQQSNDFLHFQFDFGMVANGKAGKCVSNSIGQTEDVKFDNPTH